MPYYLNYTQLTSKCVCKAFRNGMLELLLKIREKQMKISLGSVEYYHPKRLKCNLKTKMAISIKLQDQTIYRVKE